MYFYILDGDHQPTIKLAERLKRELTQLGIAGEVTLTSSSTPVTRLVETGLIKGYTTLVAVGPDAHINAVAHHLLHQEVAFGFVPTESPSLYATVMGIKEWKEAIPILRNRRIDEVGVGETDEGQIFLDRVTVHNPKGQQLKVALPQLELELNSPELTILNGGMHGPRSNQLFLEAIDAEAAGFSFFKLFGKPADPQTNTTRLASKTLAILGDPDLSVRLDGVVTLKLPLVVRVHPKALRVVVARADPAERVKKVVKAELLS